MPDRRRIPWEDPRDIALADQFHSRSAAGKAFRVMIDLGCDPEFLESRLIGLQIYEKRTTKHYAAADLRRLKGIISKLEDSASELRHFVPMMIFSGIRDWPIDPLALPGTLARLARTLDEASKKPIIRNLKNPTAGERVADLMNEIVEQIGRPHYSTMAYLIGAALGHEAFSENDLKMMVKRNTRVRPKKVTLA